MALAIPRNTAIAVLVVALIASLSSPVQAGRKAKKSNAKPARVAPANDDFAAATPIESLRFSSTTDHTRATTEEGEPLGCGAISQTVWFTFVPSSNLEIVARATSATSQAETSETSQSETSETPQSAVAVYTGEELTTIEQIGCSDSPGTAQLAFYAERGTTYAIQVGPIGSGEGEIKFELARGTEPQPLFGEPGSLPHGWKERVLAADERSHQSDGMDLIRFHGRPSAADPAMYEMDVWVAGQHVVDRLALYTAGTMKQEHSYSALGPSTQRVSFSVKVRYDTRGQRCLAGLGGQCQILLPNLPELSEVTTGKSARAELIVSVLVERQASLAAIPETRQTLRIPLVGYVAALLP